MSAYRAVDDVWLNSLLVDDGLDVLMHVMVDMLASNGWLHGAGMVAVNSGRGVFVLRSPV